MRKNYLIAGTTVIAALTAGLALQTAIGATAPGPSLATVAGGQLQGKIAGDVVSFKAVPYAAPPIGALRWREPQPVKQWAGVRDALAFGAPCAQANLEWNKSTAAKSSEDCLLLNVWAPVRRDKALPVMIFFPGGAYHGGGAQGANEIEPSYDGGKLAARGIIVVTANYRLGMFGFMAHPELSAQSPHHVSGNYALLDQIAALNWVKANIAKFGGDPANVTISGQSAGSYSVGFLMTSPLAKGLFAKAIGFSGTVADFRLGASELKTAENDGAKFAKALGAPDKGGIDALRKKSAAELFKIMMASEKLHAIEPRGPVVDGYAFPEQPSLAFKQGHEAQVPFIIGNTARDGDVDSMGVSGTPKAAATLADKTRPLVGTHKVAALGPEGVKRIEDYYAPNADLAPGSEALQRQERNRPGGRRRHHCVQHRHILPLRGGHHRALARPHRADLALPILPWLSAAGRRASVGHDACLWLDPGARRPAARREAGGSGTALSGEFRHQGRSQWPSRLGRADRPMPIWTLSPTVRLAKPVFAQPPAISTNRKSSGAWPR